MPRCQLFTLGVIVATPAALRTIEMCDGSFTALLARHATGDWGDMDPADAALNNEAVSKGNDRILSSYKIGQGEKVWIITERDRSSTTILLPDEY